MKTGSFAVIALLATATATATAQSDDIDYSYLQGGFQTATGGGGSGVFLGGSYRFDEKLYAAASFDTREDSGFSTDVLSARVGYIHPVDNFHLYAEGGLARTSYEYSDCDSFLGDKECFSISASTTGLMLEGGVRYRYTSNIEARGAVRHIAGDVSDTALTAEGIYHFNQQWSALGAISLFDGSDMLLQLGARFHF